MNKEKALKLLKEYLIGYGREFIFHSCFIDELKDLVVKNARGSEEAVFNLLVKQFSFVKSLGRMVNSADSNEILKGIKSEQDFYSLHIQNRIVNIRVLMTFLDNVPIFLGAFFEREGKKATDYSKYEDVMKERLEQIKGGGNNDK